MAFGVTNLFGLTAPTVGFVAESTRDKSVDLVKLQDQSGTTRCVSPISLVKIEVSIKGKGDITLGELVSTDITEKGVIEIISKKRAEVQSDYPDFEASAIGYEDLPASSPSGGGATPPAAAGEGVCPVIGLVSVGQSGVTNFDIEEKLEEATPLLNADGTFQETHLYDPHFEFSVKGKGAYPLTLLIGSDGDLPSTVGEFGSGVTVITSTKEGQKKTDYADWEASGEHWPNAA